MTAKSSALMPSERNIATGSRQAHSERRPVAAVEDRLELLDGGVEAYPRMLAAIAQSRRYIRLEVYRFSLDSIGARFLEELSRAALRGVAVHVVIDGWGTLRGGRTIAQRLGSSGCTVEIYHPLHAALVGKFGRTHRKMLVVDDAIAYIGGINIGEEYSGEPGSPAWADLALEIEGPVCRRLGRLFYDQPVRKLDGPFSVHFSRLGEGRRLKKRYLWALARARKRILIAHGYFLPDRQIIRAILAAARRGVLVCLLLAGESDVPFARLATRRLYRRLIAAGVRIYEWEGSILHAKVASIDSRCLLIGSFNLDPFSLANREVLTEITEHSVVEEGEHWILERLRASNPVTAVEVGSWLTRWFWEPCGAAVARLAEALARMLSPAGGPRSRRTAQLRDAARAP
jgi:cardiolipin synthase